MLACGQPHESVRHALCGMTGHSERPRRPLIKYGQGLVALAGICGATPLWRLHRRGAGHHGCVFTIRVFELGYAGDVRRIQVPTLTRSFADGLRRPVFSLLVGGLAGGMLINLVSSAVTDTVSTRIAYAVGGIAILITLLVLGNWLGALYALRTDNQPDTQGDQI